MSSALQQSLSSSTASPVPADPLDLELEERSMDEEHGAASGGPASPRRLSGGGAPGGGTGDRVSRGGTSVASARRWSTMLRTCEHRTKSSFQSLDYDPIASVFSEKKREMHNERKWYGYSGASVGRWVITLAVGMGIGLVAFGMSASIERILDAKMKYMRGHGDQTTNMTRESGDLADTVAGNSRSNPFLFFIFWNAVLALLACLPTVFIAPEAAGSGIPEVMGYLNGVHIRSFLRLKTLAVKLWGTVLIVSSGLAVGPEGPLVHMGAILGSGLTRGHKTCGRKRVQSPHLFAMFHNDTDRRDFISMGAAAGFAAAFGAPIGGVLFALEEASSFWSAKLMWRLLLCTSTACFTLSILRTIRSSLGPEVEEDGQLGAGEINAKFEPGMLTLNTQKDLNFKHEWELIICAIEGCMCGVLGALFNKLNEVVSGWRPKARPTTAKDVAPLIRLLGVSRQHSLRIIEVLVISVVTSIVMYGLPYWGATSSHWVAFYPDNSTEILGPDGEKMGWACHCDDSVFPYCGRQAPAVQSYRYSTYSFYCPPQDIYGNQIYNDMASIFLSSRENAILSLIEHPHNFSFTSLTLMGLSFFFLMLLAFGAAYPAGIFMPTVVIGTTFGALFGRFVKYFLCFALTKGCTIAGGDKNVDVQDSSWTNHDDSFRATTIEHAGPYALLGAVGLLGGIQRSSLSLVVIIVEGTGKVDYLLPIILTTVCAKWVGDHLNEGFYHNALHIKGIPFLDNEPTRAMNTLTAENIMSRNVKVLHERSTVADVIDLLESTEHDGFPVVREKSMGKDVVLNIYRGTVLRSTLAALISRRRFYREAIGGEQDAAGRAKLERVPSRLLSTPSSESLMATSSGKIDFDLVARSTSRHSDNGGERGSIYSQTMEPPAPMLSPATRQTLMEMSEAEHRSSNQSFLKGVLADVTEAEHQMLLDVSEAMNQAPYSVLSTTRGEKVHRLFRTMGLRHLVVTDEVNEVVGMITRQDLIVAMETHHADGPSSHHHDANMM